MNYLKKNMMLRFKKKYMLHAREDIKNSDKLLGNDFTNKLFS